VERYRREFSEWGFAMQSVDYRRLGKALVEIAVQQRNLTDRARWMAVAQACLDVEAELTSTKRADRFALRQDCEPVQTESTKSSARPRPRGPLLVTLSLGAEDFGAHQK
jgi:hypothetical protein